MVRKLLQLPFPGNLSSVAGSEVEDIDVTYEGEFIGSEQTDNLGDYLLELPEFASFTVRPEKNDAWSQDVTIADLVKIQMHIVLSDTLDSPYKIIAADANKDGNVTISDLNALLQIITGNWTEISGNTSFRFVPSDYIFADPLDPLSEDFPEEVKFTDQITDGTADFRVIKVGNVLE